MRIRDSIKSLLVRPVAFHPVLARICKSASAGLMLSQALYWSDVQERTHPEAGGWFYKTADDWTEEVCLTRYEQEGARKTLRKLGFWQEARRGVGALVHFRVDMDKLALAIAQYAENADSAIGKYQNQENADSESGKTANQNQEKANSLNREAESTSETTHRLKSAAQKNSATPNRFPTIPLNTGKDFEISEAQLCEWQALYPAVDVTQELRKMRGWSLANRRNRKTRGGVERFINQWLSTAQDEAPSKRARTDSSWSDADLGMHRDPVEIDCELLEKRRSAFIAAHGDARLQGQADAAWATCDEYLHKKLSPHSYDLWIRPCRVLCMSGRVLYVGIPTQEFVCLCERYSAPLSEVKNLLNIERIEFICFEGRE